MLKKSRNTFTIGGGAKGREEGVEKEVKRISEKVDDRKRGQVCPSKQVSWTPPRNSRVIVIVIVVVVIEQTFLFFPHYPDTTNDYRATSPSIFFHDYTFDRFFRSY